jgi:DNA-damage-inducible protein J
MKVLKMPKTDVITIRVDHHLKEKTIKVLDKLGITMSQAMMMFLKQVELQKGLPFDVKIPNKKTLAAMQEVEDTIAGKKSAKSYSSFKEMAEDPIND